MARGGGDRGRVLGCVKGGRRASGPPYRRRGIAGWPPHTHSHGHGGRMRASTSCEQGGAGGWGRWAGLVDKWVVALGEAFSPFSIVFVIVLFLVFFYCFILF